MASLYTRKLGLEEERALAGRLAGVMFLTGGLTAVLFLFLPGIEDRHWEWVVALAGLCVVWGLISLTFARAAPGLAWRRHIPAICTLGVIVTAMAATGGADSPARFYAFFLLVFVTHYFPRRHALVYLPGCVAVALSPLLYDTAATSGGYLGELVVICPAYVVVGGLIMDGKSLLVDLRERAHSLALMDTLTELPNRRAMLDWLESHMGAEEGLGLMLVDLDGFKDVNTVYGYPAGDAVLREAARRVRSCVRDDDLVARLGGDEFAVLASAADPARMEMLSARVLQAVRAMEHPGPGDVRLTASVGWALHPVDAGTVDELIAAADICMRGAKLTGKDRALSAVDWSPAA
ncbi:MAG: GGDEF domain-containing protein [Thermoleophilaceae bacterium]